MQFAYFKKIPLLILCLVFGFLGNAQEKTITGKVSDETLLTPLAGATIMVQGTNKAVITNEQGEFAIIASPNQVLVISYTGYEPKSIAVSGPQELFIRLRKSESIMDEVVTIGYGTQRKSRITGSVSKLDAKVLETGVRSNPASALAGTIPGLRVQQTSGRPGAVPIITLRGGTNFGNSGTPLVLVDGLLRDAFSDINAEDIESMETLKDASATAIYGARANNGVILITTRKGKAGVSKITVTGRIGVNKLNLPFEFLDAKNYLKWSRLAVKTSGAYDASRLSQLTNSGPFGTGNRFLDANGNVIDGNKNSLGVWSTMKLDNTNRQKLNDGWQWMIDPANNTDTLIFNDFNYKSFALRSHTITQDYNVNFSGGNDKGSYYAGLGYYDEAGMPINTFYRRLTFVINGEYKVKPWLTSISAINFADAKWRNAVTNTEGNYLSRSLGAPPTMRGYNENGELLIGRDLGDGNPAVNDDKFIRKNNTDKFTLTQGFKINFLQNLSIKTTASWYYDEGHYESFNRDYLQSPGNINTTRASSASFGRALSQTYNAIMNYNTTIASKHNIDAMVGTEFYDRYNKGLSASGQQAPSDDFMDLQYVKRDKDVQPNVDSYHNRERILSYFGRINYDYDLRYLLTLTFRRDGYSKLINNRWGNFPGISVGWNIHKENFFHASMINLLKLRASYGENGNVNPDYIGPYTLQGSYGVVKYSSSPGYLFVNPPVPDLRWEHSATVEVGLDATMFHKLDVSVAAYRRLTDDKITGLSFPATAGVGGVITNNGSFQNKGIEMEVNYRAIKNKDFSLTVSANAAYNANKIIKLPNNGVANNRQGGLQVYDPTTKSVIWVGGNQEGQDPNVAYSYVAEGIYKTQSELDADGNRVDLNGAKVLLGTTKYNSLSAADKAKYYGIALGDVKWKDVDKNDTIDYRDRVYMGRTVPRWTGGLSAYANWKGVSISTRFDFAAGYVAYDGPRAWFMGNAQGTFNTITDVYDTWTPENSDARFPKYYWADQLFKNNVLRPSSMFYHNSSYIAFRDLTIGYELPNSVLTKLKSQGLNLTFTIQNIGYLSKSTLYTPESFTIDNAGAGSGGYPLPRTFIFGAKFTF